MKDPHVYRVDYEYSGQGLERSCMVTVTDQWGTVWQHRQIDRDCYEKSRDFYRAIDAKIEEYKAVWERGE